MIINLPMMKSGSIDMGQCLVLGGSGNKNVNQRVFVSMQ
jgi:hypothetical protein